MKTHIKNRPSYNFPKKLKEYILAEQEQKQQHQQQEAAQQSRVSECSKYSATWEFEVNVTNTIFENEN